MVNPVNPVNPVRLYQEVDLNIRSGIKVCRLSEVALKGHFEKKLKDDNITIVKDEESAVATTCRYVDWLLSTYNANNPDENNWIKPVIQPCQMKHIDANMSHRDKATKQRRIAIKDYWRKKAEDLKTKQRFFQNF